MFLTRWSVPTSQDVQIDLIFAIIISISVDTMVAIVKLDAVKVTAMPSAEKLAMLLLCLFTTFACSA